MVQNPGFQFEDNAELVGLMSCEGGVTESDARIKSRLTWRHSTVCRAAKQWGPAEEIVGPDCSETRDSFHPSIIFWEPASKYFCRTTRDSAENRRACSSTRSLQFCKSRLRAINRNSSTLAASSCRRHPALGIRGRRDRRQARISHWPSSLKSIRPLHSSKLAARSPAVVFSLRRATDLLFPC